MRVAIADLTVPALEQVGSELVKIYGEANVLVVPTDVSDEEQVVALKDKVYENWGEVVMKTLPVSQYRESPSTWGVCSAAEHL